MITRLPRFGALPEGVTASPRREDLKSAVMLKDNHLEILGSVWVVKMELNKFLGWGSPCHCRSR